jgi:hypothetical protein
MGKLNGFQICLCKVCPSIFIKMQHLAKEIWQRLIGMELGLRQSSLQLRK